MTNDISHKNFKVFDISHASMVGDTDLWTIFGLDQRPEG